MFYFVKQKTISSNEKKDIGRGAEVWDAKERSSARKRKEKEKETEKGKAKVFLKKWKKHVFSTLIYSGYINFSSNFPK